MTYPFNSLIYDCLWLCVILGLVDFSHSLSPPTYKDAKGAKIIYHIVSQSVIYPTLTWHNMASSFGRKAAPLHCSSYHYYALSLPSPFFLFNFFIQKHTGLAAFLRDSSAVFAAALTPLCSLSIEITPRGVCVCVCTYSYILACGTTLFV